MGFPPPPDAPSPEQQDQASALASFEPSPSGATICGFGPPSFEFSLQIPGFKIPDFTLPTFNLALALSCDASNPIESSFEFGGGRIGSNDVDQDDEFDVA